MRLAVIIATLLWAGTAAADLYRWVDPETGSVKLSSYPPPWYGDEAKQRRAPKVEVIPARGEPAAKPDTAVKGAEAAARRNDAPAKSRAETRPGT